MRKFSHYLWVLAGAELGQSVRRFPSRRGRPSTVYLEHGPKQVGKITLVSWQQPRGVLVEARTIEIKILFLVFFPLILDMLSRLRFWINIVRLRWYFYAVLELIFFLHHSWMWVQTEIRSMVIFIYCFLKLKNSRVNRNFLKCFLKFFFFIVLYIESITYGFDIYEQF